MGTGFTGYQFLNMMFIVTVALLVVRDKRLGKISMSQ